MATTKYTDEAKANIIADYKKHIKAKLGAKEAAERVGVSLSSLKRWMALERNPEPKGPSVGSVNAKPKRVPKPKAEPKTAKAKLPKKANLVELNQSRETMIKLSVIRLPDSIAVSLNTESLSLGKERKQYADLDSYLKSIQSRAQNNVVTPTEADSIRELVYGKAVKEVREWSNGSLSIIGGIPKWKGKPLNGKLQQVLLQTAKAGDIAGLDRFAKFQEKVSQAISWKVTHRLFEFINNNSLAIDEDGDIIAFKVVTEKYLDKHTKSISNAVGTEISCARNEVDDRDDVTCSNGYHACAYKYIGSFSSSGDRVVLVKIDPRDFVSVPVDYNSTKARVCRYKVIKDVTPQWINGTLEKIGALVYRD